jgi:hypothetical protein
MAKVRGSGYNSPLAVAAAAAAAAAKLLGRGGELCDMQCSLW